MHYLHHVLNNFTAVLNILTIYKQASSKSSACSNIRSWLDLFKETFDIFFYLHLNQW